MLDYTAWNDEELIREYRATQNQQIMAILFTRYADVGFRTAMRFMKNQADAEDVLQMSYIHFIQNLDLFREGITIRPWLMKMIVNTCKNKLIEEKRRQNRQNKIASERFEKNTNESSVENANSENAELKVKLRQGVDMLPEKYRSPLWLVMFEEISYSEVAEVLELPEKTIRTQVARGLERLRKNLASLGAVLSITSISDLIKNTTLEKAPTSVNSIVNSPEIYRLAASSKTKILKYSTKTTHFSAFHFLSLSLGALLVILFYLNIKPIHSDNDVSEKTIPTKANQVTKAKPYHLSLNFNQKNDLKPFEYLGSYENLEVGGIDNSGCIEISKKLILRIPIENDQLPLKISFRRNFKYDKEGIVGLSWLTWGEWDRMSILDDDTPIRNLIASPGKYVFEKDQDWEIVTFTITKDFIDVWNDYGRINLYLMELKGENKYLYLNIVDRSKIDNFKIETIQVSSLPDISLLQKINSEVYLTSKEEITSIKKYFPESQKVKINHQKFKASAENDLIIYMKNMVNTK